MGEFFQWWLITLALVAAPWVIVGIIGLVIAAILFGVMFAIASVVSVLIRPAVYLLALSAEAALLAGIAYVTVHYLL